MIIIASLGYWTDQLRHQKPRTSSERQISSLFAWTMSRSSQIKLVSLRLVSTMSRSPRHSSEASLMTWARQKDGLDKSRGQRTLRRRDPSRDTQTLMDTSALDILGVSQSAVDHNNSFPMAYNCVLSLYSCTCSISGTIRGKHNPSMWRHYSDRP